MEACCEKQENRVTLERKNDLTVQKCVVCDRKHYELAVDPLTVGVRAPGE